MDLKLHIGQVINSHREAKGWSQEFLGLEVGVSQQTVSDYEHGLTEITVDLLLKFGEVLGIPRDKFFEPLGTDMYDYIEDCKTRIKKSREILDVLDSDPVLKDAVRYYGKNKDNLKEINVYNFLRKVSKVPKDVRKNVIKAVNKLVG